MLLRTIPRWSGKTDKKNLLQSVGPAIHGSSGPLPAHTIVQSISQKLFPDMAACSASCGLSARASATCARSRSS